MRVFPNEAALLRLVTAILAEIDEEWSTNSRVYINMERRDDCDTNFSVYIHQVAQSIEITDHPETPCLLHVVGHVASLLQRLDGWPDGIDTTRVVMIVAGPGRHAAQEMLARFLPELAPFNPSMRGRRLESSKR